MNKFVLTALIALFLILSSALGLALVWIKKSLYKDELTGLLTTKKFLLEVKKLLKKSRGVQYSLVSLDINSFRYITQVFGQDNGNRLLEELGRLFRKTAPKGSLLCRNYNDNFAFLLKTTILPILEDIIISMTSVNDSIKQLLPKHFKLEFSIGVYEIKDPKEEPLMILDKAQTARKVGKSSLNPKRLCVFTPQMEIDSQLEKDIIFDMERAFKENEFVVYYQPKFLFNTEKIIGAEALVRWNHKKRGLLTPSYFVPMFEKNGFIEKIDLFVFENVCQFLDSWNKSQKDKKEKQALTISCNLSRVQLYNPDIAKIYRDIASKYEIAPSTIEIELTESLMMDNKDRLLKAMNEIKNAGFSISVDDFGSGFSSLSLLKDLPANVIKLDKEFLNTQNTEKEHIIINSVINMAKNLDMATVAEGVEDERQSALLKKMGCDIVQGFYYAKPMPQNEFNKFLSEQKTEQ
ncbi:MAG: GGDEF domain-containing phosphodiesterase [Spirochaetia bacterium]|uniref:putative bifunctional diguanylate cyclase/phosphodiesterase n=1 Tax=Treponema berlinense TaxID=225004 RepID=UPI0015BC2DFA|nr:GGDEF domain-containing phosphodiesterase [Treponema berlinense]MDD5790809.1 GGDEF domain-containing phosphodiesterase [Spirochaetia bacterium]